MLKINLTCKLNRISDTLMDLDKIYLILRFDLRVKPIFLIPHLIPEILIDSKVVKIDPKRVFSLILRRLSQFIWYTLYLCTMVFYGLFCNIFFVCAASQPYCWIGKRILFTLFVNLLQQSTFWTAFLSKMSKVGILKKIEKKRWRI